MNLSQHVGRALNLTEREAHGCLRALTPLREILQDEEQTAGLRALFIRYSRAVYKTAAASETDAMRAWHHGHAECAEHLFKILANFAAEVEETRSIIIQEHGLEATHE